VLRVEPEILATYVANGRVALSFWPVLDHGPSLVVHHAAECAGAQDPLQFWAMHDLLFERQGDLWSNTANAVTNLAAELGLAEDAFAACLTDPDVTAKVTRLDQERRAAGIRLRPSFDINGRTFAGAQAFDIFARIFDEILAE
jgi:protein-disulfide isomerase